MTDIKINYVKGSFTLEFDGEGGSTFVGDRGCPGTDCIYFIKDGVIHKCCKVFGSWCCAPLFSQADILYEIPPDSEQAS